MDDPTSKALKDAIALVEIAVGEKELAVGLARLSEAWLAAPDGELSDRAQAIYEREILRVPKSSAPSAEDRVGGLAALQARREKERLEELRRIVPFKSCPHCDNTHFRVTKTSTRLGLATRAVVCERCLSVFLVADPRTNALDELDSVSTSASQDGPFR